ncbi:matrix metalloproteinase-21-like [Anomaloglossus baeobatrachus]
MGAKYSPPVANLTMSWWEGIYIYDSQNPFLKDIIWHGRFIDDLLIIWTGCEPAVQDFIFYLNNNVFNLEFKVQHSHNTTQFLDLTLEGKMFSKISTKTYRKQIAGNTILHATSHHPAHTIKAIPLGEIIRANRNCNTPDSYSVELNNIETRLQARGYKNWMITRAKKIINKKIIDNDSHSLESEPRRCSGRFSTVFDWLLPDHSSPGSWLFQTYFFRGSWYWMYENRSNRTRYRDPRVTSSGWRGIPRSDIDAYVQIWTRDLTFFFKGTQYWRYDNENDRAYTLDPDGHAYPRLISEGFPGISGPIDTAFYDHEERKVYFFRGRNVTAFSVNNHNVVPGYPKAIIDVFPAYVQGDHPLSDLDAVYYSFSHRSVFFFKDVYVWKMAGGQQDTISHNALLQRNPINEQWFDICDVHSSMLSTQR